MITCFLLLQQLQIVHMVNFLSKAPPPPTLETLIKFIFFLIYVQWHFMEILVIGYVFFYVYYLGLHIFFFNINSHRVSKDHAEHI